MRQLLAAVTITAVLACAGGCHGRDSTADADHGVYIEALSVIP